MKLNIGCGPNRLDGWVNIDACDLFKPDLIFRLPVDTLTGHFGSGIVDEILADDMLEHLFRWEGIKALADFHSVLRPGGKLSVKTPCLGAILKDRIPLWRKLQLIRGYQGQRMPMAAGVLGKAWATHPEFFAHKYVWDEIELKEVLVGVGFKALVVSWNDGNSMTVKAEKLGS